ncbi:MULTISPECIES: glycosyltransferase family 2 protein [unclassified Leptolyngbya]|uniref:glycosyltransferase family 2 protein n=1 Tax=unclassified Leptolyngbya TaxID=2650499 RepID=UPI001684FD1A|nr:MULTISPECIES: glycosyltransferase family 2 protein [unclassified Leptolyngbya]MBD1913921.1 glycosyltransferase family 2 protein [Leptolyngbya sp. FACHB-8]MBD2156373.1 glycosyltransferase family 2 protein [Leptolyngbya sp. FACHB-16]
MQVIGISMVKNEEDIIESFIRHNLQFLDGIIVFDNCSTDSTRLILKLLMQEGLPICLSDDYEYAYFQSEKMTNLLRRLCFTSPIDYVIPLDADEFIDCESYDVFVESLNEIESPGVGFWGWKTYVISPKLANDQSPKAQLDQFNFFRNREIPQYYKVVLRNPELCIHDLTLTQGNHNTSSSYDISKIKLRNLSLAHFPVRSKFQITKKVIFGEIAYQLKDKKQNFHDPNETRQWRSLYQRLKAGENFSESELVNISLNYAQTPGNSQWPDNIRSGKFKLVGSENQYDEVVSSNLLMETVRSFQNYIKGPEIHFNPYELYNTDVEPGTFSEQNQSINTAFEPDWHLKNLFLDIPPFRYLYERFSPVSALDIGCGLGQYLKLLNNFGVAQIAGIDGIEPEALYIPASNYLTHDLHQPLELSQKFDLVICSEVAEHLNPGSEAVLLDNIERHAGHIVLFSAAAPDQPGYGHINCKPFAFWAEQWASRGWVPLLFETLCFRTLSTFSWLRRNPVLMVRAEDESDILPTWLPLVLIHEEDYAYKPQPPGIIINPLAHTIPELQ